MLVTLAATHKQDTLGQLLGDTLPILGQPLEDTLLALGPLWVTRLLPELLEAIPKAVLLQAVTPHLQEPPGVTPLEVTPRVQGEQCHPPHLGTSRIGLVDIKFYY